MKNKKENIQTFEDTDLRKLSSLLEKILAIFEYDRKLAITNYEKLREQLDNILENGVESSEDGRIESEVNKALKNVFDSATRLQGVIDTTSRVIIAQLNADAKRDVASIFNQGGGFKKVNIQNLLEDKPSSEEEPDYENDEG